MRFLFVMDPASSMHPEKDTTFAFMRGAKSRGHASFHCLPSDVSNLGRDLFATARPIDVSDVPPHTTLGAPVRLELSALDAVFIRKDPPFDPAYAHLTHQLELVKDRVLVLNDPSGLRHANEKLFAFHFTEFMPRSLVTAKPAEIVEFVKQVGGQAVLKPIDGAGGSGVVVLRSDDRNTRSLADVWTREGKELALVQEYEPAVRTGDKRVLMLDGKVLGAILRVPRADDVRANIHAGGRVEATDLTEKEQELAAAIGPRLSAEGLYFVGLDLIGEKLIEVNVTSPTGIQELGRHLGRPVEEDVIAWVEARAGQ
jgi:glutathione synthase